MEQFSSASNEAYSTTKKPSAFRRVLGYLCTRIDPEPEYKSYRKPYGARDFFRALGARIDASLDPPPDIPYAHLEKPNCYAVQPSYYAEILTDQLPENVIPLRPDTTENEATPPDKADPSPPGTTDIAHTMGDTDALPPTQRMQNHRTFGSHAVDAARAWSV
ncbi:hypothetical protein CR970_01450 [Candidatus Saccharibacteria bacterium]|nr:MAG: hypothetical protein CR970_01450 [Candidatus Saccharibacteria bacterium]